MRKHFLILMLLTLLPLAGFAQINIENCTFTLGVTSYGYTGAVPNEATLNPTVTRTDVNPAVVLTKGTDYELVYYKDDVETAKANIKNAGTYAVAARGKGTYTGETEKVEFNITKVALYTKGTAGSKTYGASEPASVYSLTKVLTKDGDNDLTTTFTGKVSFERDGGTHYQAAGYAISATITDATLNTNYTIAKTDVKNSDASAQAKFMINQKALPAFGSGSAQALLTVSGNEKTYSGVAQTVTTIKIHDNALNQDLRPQDFEVKYGDAGNDANETNANEEGYKITVKLKASGDYYGDNRVLTQKFVINKKTLKVYVNEIEKVYDGTDAIPATATFGYSGLVGADQQLAAPFGEIYDVVYADPSGTSAEKYVGDYNLVPQENGTAATGTYANYNISFLATGTLTVNQRPLELKAVEASKSYGANDPALAFTVQAWDAENEEGVFAADADVFANNYKCVRPGKGTDEAVNTTGYAGALQVQKNAEVTEADQKIIDQYDITLTPAKFIITAASLTVYPKAKVITYGTSYSLSDFEIIAVNTGGKKVTLTTSPTVHIQGYDDDNLPTDANIYTLVLEGTAAAEGYSDTPEFLEAQFTIAPKNLTITPKAQTLHVGDTKAALATYNTDNSKVTFTGLVGNDKIKYELDFNTVDALPLDGKIPTFEAAAQDAQDAMNYTKETANAYNAAHVAGCVATGFEVSTTSAPTLDEVNAVLVTDMTAGAMTVDQAYEYNCSKTGHVTIDDIETPASPATPAVVKGIDNDGKLLVAETYAKGIKVTPIDLDPNDEDDDQYANNNYNIIVANQTAALTVVAAATFILNDEDADLLAKIAAANGTEKNVTFSARTLNAEKWNAMVLPFNVTMNQLIAAFNEYVVVDVLKNTSDGNAHFKLNLDEIPANTPFLIMTKSAKNMNTVNFANVTIKYVTTGAEQTVRDTEGNPYVETDGNVKFVGVYKKQEFYANEYIKYMSQGQFYTAKNYTQANPLIQKSLRAYLDLTDVTNNAAPMIYIENPDGSTTAISAINSDNMVENYTKDGWYTVNGMKLEGMPIEKGIYIHNGKKVVLK